MLRTHRRAKLFRFDSSSSEWKERGTGDVRLLQNNDTKKVRLVMRRDKTLKVCANHASESFHLLMTRMLNTMTLFIRKVTADMHLQPNIGSDRSWVWKVAADYSESPPTAETLAIRFANSNSKSGLLIGVLYWPSTLCKQMRASLKLSSNAHRR
jgi:Ran-binding protein 1